MDLHTYMNPQLQQQQRKNILVEGINNSGKDRMIMAILKEYGDLIDYVKFPNNPAIIEQINYLYETIHLLTKDAQIKQLHIIHNLFDLDFRIYHDNNNPNPKKFLLVNRHYISNIVYSNLHKVWQPYWNDHEMDFEFCFWLKVHDEEKDAYYNSFPQHISTVPTYYQQITPEILFREGQEFYEDALRNQKSRGKIKFVLPVDAWRDEITTSQVMTAMIGLTKRYVR